MAEQFTREDLLGAVVAHFGPFSPHADTLRTMLTQIERLLADLDEANRGWEAACDANRRAVADNEWLRRRVADMRSTIADLELRLGRGEG